MHLKDDAHKIFPSAQEDAELAEHVFESSQTRSPSYKLAFMDQDFLLQDELRPVRLQLELLKPELIQREMGIQDTVVIFGSTKIREEAHARLTLKEAEAAAALDPRDERLARNVRVARSLYEKSRYYEEARKLASLISSNNGDSLVVVTGGGPGIMEAANRGAYEVGAKTVGLSVILPNERPNIYITPDLCFQFHYFALRKMHFLMRAKALVVFPGGFGTLDELFETLTLMQTRKIHHMPVMLVGERYWKRIINFEALMEEGSIAFDDLSIFSFVETAEEAWATIRDKLSL